MIEPDALGAAREHPIAGTHSTPSSPETPITTIASPAAVRGTARRAAPRRSRRARGGRPCGPGAVGVAAHGGVTMPSTPAAAKNVRPSASADAPSASRRSGARTSSDAERDRRQRGQPHPGEHRAVAQGLGGRGDRLALGVADGLRPRPHPERQAEHDRRGERDLLADARAPRRRRPARAGRRRSRSPSRCRASRRAARAAPRSRPTSSRPPTRTRRRRPAGTGPRRAPRSTSPNANARHDSDMSARPMITVAFTPARAIAHPAGSEPSSVPAA